MYAFLGVTDILVTFAAAYTALTAIPHRGGPPPPPYHKLNRKGRSARPLLIMPSCGGSNEPISWLASLTVTLGASSLEVCCAGPSQRTAGSSGPSKVLPRTPHMPPTTDADAHLGFMWPRIARFEAGWYS